ncbi:cation efflux system protein [Segetibacter aerophilus]|uniref:Cation efflux system protein n=2 Tax=Segetibacter aerophilus TaxID=670293 RepID=A0A512BHI3_9BACT|nr:cation efflux system protein [Segetibacter aerophilus]
MEHNHSHHDHSHSIVLTNVNSSFVIGIVLNFLFVVIEVVVGLSVKSLSLLSDAGHNLVDVGSLALSLLAFRLMKVKSNPRYTYGYRKTTILVALFNGAVLLISIGAIIYEALHRFNNPEPLPGKTIAIVAGIGIAINFITALLFFKNKENDLNIKSAYLHLMADAAVSAGIVVGGIVMMYTNWFWIDPVISIVIALVILGSTWKLLKDSLRLSLDGVPKNIDLEKIKTEALKIAGIKNIHHIHVWALSTSENAMTVHLVLDTTIDKKGVKAVKDELKHRLLHMNIQHMTIETEFADDPCVVTNC